MGGGQQRVYSNPYQNMSAPDDAIRVPWKGYYMQGGNKNTMDLDDMQITLDGRIFCEGSDTNGQFRIDGQINPNGSFFFNKQYLGMHCVSYSGAIRDGALIGTWSLQTMRDEFQISIESQDWQGSFMMGDRTFPMKTKLYVSESGVFGIGKDSEGVFICSGYYDGGSSSLQYSKQYLGKYSITYNGTMFDDGMYLVVHGNWSLSTGQVGTFEMYQKIEGRVEQYRQFYSPPPPPQNYAPTFYGMPQNQVPQQYHANMQMGGYQAGYAAPGYQQPQQMTGKLSDSEFVDGDIEDVNRVCSKLNAGMHISGKQLQVFIPMIQGDDSLLYFCKQLNQNKVVEFSMDNMLEALSRCRNQDLNKQTVILLHPLIQPAPGALENSKMNKLFVFNADKKEVCSTLKISI